MGLYAHINVNQKSINNFSIYRVTNTEAAIIDDDAVSTYEWQCELGLKYLFGTVEHRFGDGATALLAKVMTDATSKGAR